MKIANQPAIRKVANPAKHTRQAEPMPHVVRYILKRFEVSPSLARTIATLAMIGGR